MRRTHAAVAMVLTAAGAVMGATMTAQAEDVHRIAFAAGTTSGEVSGELPAAGEVDYVFGAAAGQTATLDFTGPASTRLVLVSPSGAPLHNGMSEQQTHVVVALPSTGDYRLAVEGGDAGAYTLDLTIPAQIRFARGATSGSVSGRIGQNGDVAYLFGARAGQTATVTFTGPADSWWTLVAPDGSPLHTGMSEQQHRASVVLPSSGSYRLDVHSRGSGPYSLTLAIPAS